MPRRSNGNAGAHADAGSDRDTDAGANTHANADACADTCADAHADTCAYADADTNASSTDCDRLCSDTGRDKLHCIGNELHRHRGQLLLFRLEFRCRRGLLFPDEYLGNVAGD